VVRARIVSRVKAGVACCYTAPAGRRGEVLQFVKPCYGRRTGAVRDALEDAASSGLCTR